MRALQTTSMVGVGSIFSPPSEEVHRRRRHCYSDSDRHANAATATGQRHAATDANTQIGAITKAAPHAFAEAHKFRRTGNFW